MAMHRIERLRDNYEYPAARRAAFEDLCTLVFCEYLGLWKTVNMRVDQKGVEADPVEATDPKTGTKQWFVYQVKYFNDGTELSDRASEFRGSIDAARELGADVLMLFVNKDQRDNDRERVFEDRLEEYAEGDQGQPSVRLDWWPLSTIELTLTQTRYSHIPDRFLGSNVGAFYRDIRERFYGDKGSELYGNVPLSECYIEPTVGAWRGGLSAHSWVESFVGGDAKVAVLCGEPGHGKSSFCRKAVCDFYESRWLKHKVHNVFCFSLNPANTAALDRTSLDFFSFFSWGQDRRNERNKLEPEQCRGALVFLDGFDELLEWKPGLDLKVFIREYVAKFQRETRSHVIVTTRNMVVESDASYLQIGRRLRVPVVRLRLISKAQQVGWIEKYVERLRQRLEDDQGSSSKKRADVVEEELDKLEAYAEEYGKIEGGIDLQSILGIPIIFRMVVAARYLPKPGESITRIYDDLFDATWARHDHKVGGSSGDPREETRGRLSRHALRVYADDADTAVVSDAPNSPWTFAFYTTHKSDGGKRGKIRVGFLHRSFYQHFLAREVVSWFERYAGSDDDENKFRDNLSYLARRRLDETTLGYINEMHGDAGGEKELSNAFAKAYEILKETDGILSLPSDGRDAAQIKSVPPLERANNVFWNVVSVCSMCGHELTADKVNVQAVKLYDLSNCYLSSAQLRGVDLREAHLAGADLQGADLEETVLDMANLLGANLMRANLKKAHLSNADLCCAMLQEADLAAANLTEANLRDANLGDASLIFAILKRVLLEGTKLKGASLFRARFSSKEEQRRAENEGAINSSAAVCDEDD